jgi:hypothetical protein
VVKSPNFEIVSADEVNSIDVADLPASVQAKKYDCKPESIGAGWVGRCRRAGWSGGRFIFNQLAGDTHW